jgi:hypothetical protein
VWELTAHKAAAALRSDVEAFERLGYRPHVRPGGHGVRLGAPSGGRDLLLRLHREGRVFGGNLGLEVATAEPLLPATAGGLSSRGRGVVRMRGVTFRARRRGDAAAAELAAALSADAALARALADVDFEAVTVSADGRPAICHLGGSVVWVLVPPIVRTTPLPPPQAEAVVRALDAFAAAAQRVATPARAHQASNSRSA